MTLRLTFEKLQQSLRMWQNEASNMAYVRRATIGGMSLGTFFGAQVEFLKTEPAGSIWYRHVFHS